jgi:hypothetical protein
MLIAGRPKFPDFKKPKINKEKSSPIKAHSEISEKI